MASMYLLSICTILLLSETRALKLQDGDQSKSEVEILTSKYNSLEKKVETMAEENKIKDTKIDILITNFKLLQDKNSLKDTKIDTLMTNFKFLQEENSLKDTKINALEENVKTLKEENNLKDKTLEFLIKQDRVKGKQIQMLENVLTNYENRQKENANIIHDSADNLDSDQTKTGNTSNAYKKNTHLEDDGLEKLVAIRRNIHRSTVISTGLPAYIPIAFHSVLDIDQLTLPGSTIKFKIETLDTRSAYNKNEGIYVVPETGIYVFSWTITGAGHAQIWSSIMVNGAARGDTLADSEEDYDYRTSTGLLVTSVNSGDHVYIQLATVHVKGYLVEKYGQCSFSGWKLA